MANSHVLSSIWMPLVTRLLVSALLGSVFIGFVSEYATYFFSWRHGARLPLEGVPFLTFTVSAISFGILLITALTVVILYGLAIQTVYVSTKYGPVQSEKFRNASNMSERFEIWRQLPLSQFLLSIMYEFTTLYLTLAGFYLLIASYYDDDFAVWFIESSWPTVLFSTPNLILVAITILIFVSLRFSNILSWIISISSIAASLFLCVALFSNYYFGTFLRHTGFGGGNEVTIIRDCHQVPACRPKLKGNLFLRTSSVAVLYYPIKESYEEVLEKDILKIQFELPRSWSLPVSKSARDSTRDLIQAAMRFFLVSN